MPKSKILLSSFVADLLAMADRASDLASRLRSESNDAACEAMDGVCGQLQAMASELEDLEDSDEN